MKKFIASISAALMLFGAVAGLTACGGGHEHVWDGGEITAAATCTSEGVKTFRCTVEGCGECYTEPVGKLNHEFTGDWVEVEGGHARQCANCTAVDGENKQIHNYTEDTEKRVPATCHSDGEKTLVCGDCGATATEAITERPDHEFTGNWIAVDGGHARQCANCTAVDGENKQIHNYTEDTEKRVPATCHSDGVKTLVCDECGATTTEAITERPDHEFTGEWVEVDGGHARQCANCTAVDGEHAEVHNFESQPLISDGAETHRQNCAVCGAASESVAHVWGEETVVTEATFYKTGKNEKECACGAKTEIIIPALDSMGVSIDDESWQFGTGAITNFDTCEYTFTQLTQKNKDGDGYTDVNPEKPDDPHNEIKAGWFGNKTFDTFVIITYTFEDDVSASVVASFKGIGNTENDPAAAISDYSLRIGVKDGNALKDVTFNRGTQFTTDPYVKDFKKGDTLVFIFKHETDGWDQGDYIITINKAQPTDNAE